MGSGVVVLLVCVFLFVFFFVLFFFFARCCIYEICVHLCLYRGWHITFFSIACNCTVVAVRWSLLKKKGFKFSF